MRQYNIEKAERVTQTKAIFVTLLVHFGLLYGLLYMNNDQPSDLVPEFVKEWVQTDESKETVASYGKRP
ncbi:MAG: hypothetical protein AB8G86_12035 [Saprospiraceae bacterium]